MDVVKLVAPDPFIICIIDLETAVWGDIIGPTFMSVHAILPRYEGKATGWDSGLFLEHRQLGNSPLRRPTVSKIPTNEVPSKGVTNQIQ